MFGIYIHISAENKLGDNPGLQPDLTHTYLVRVKWFSNDFSVLKS